MAPGSHLLGERLPTVFGTGGVVLRRPPADRRAPDHRPRRGRTRRRGVGARGRRSDDAPRAHLARLRRQQHRSPPTSRRRPLRGRRHDVVRRHAVRVQLHRRRAGPATRRSDRRPVLPDRSGSRHDVDVPSTHRRRADPAVRRPDGDRSRHAGHRRRPHRLGRPDRAGPRRVRGRRRRPTPPASRSCLVSSTPTCTSASARRASEEELSIHTPARVPGDPGVGRRRPRCSRAGVTTACDPGGPQGIAVAVRDAIEAGLVVGPRLSAAGRQITTQQGIGDTLPSWIGPLSSSFGVLVRGVDDIVQEIRDEVKDGVDLIKIAGSGPGTEEYGAFSRPRAGRGRRRSAPARPPDHDPRPIARSRSPTPPTAGFDWIMHASYMDAPTLEKVIERDIPLVPAMTLLVNFLEGGDAMPPAAARRDAARARRRRVDPVQGRRRRRDADRRLRVRLRHHARTASGTPASSSSSSTCSAWTTTTPCSA